MKFHLGGPLSCPFLLTCTREKKGEMEEKNNSDGLL